MDEPGAHKAWQFGAGVVLPLGANGFTILAGSAWWSHFYFGWALREFWIFLGLGFVSLLGCWGLLLYELNQSRRREDQLALDRKRRTPNMLVLVLVGTLVGTIGPVLGGWTGSQLFWEATVLRHEVAHARSMLVSQGKSDAERVQWARERWPGVTKASIGGGYICAYSTQVGALGRDVGFAVYFKGDYSSEAAPPVADALPTSVPGAYYITEP